MADSRVFNSQDYFQLSDNEPIRSVINSSSDANIVAWYLKPGQSIAPHKHPYGQDTWPILSGEGDYVIDEEGTETKVKAGNVVVAFTNQVHGLHNRSAEPLYFISVVSPTDAGYELLQD